MWSLKSPSCVIFISLAFVINQKWCSCAQVTVCKITDEVCINNVFNSALHNVTSGVPALGIQRSDPMYIDVIYGEQPTLKYTDRNNTITGLKNCIIKDVRISNDLKVAQFSLDCPGFNLSAVGRSEGYHFAIPVLAVGDLEIDYGCYEIVVYALITIAKNMNGDNIIQLGQYSIDPQPLSKTVYKFSSVYSNGQDITAVANAMATKYWKYIAFFSREPVMNAIMNRLISDMNKYFRLALPVQLKN